MPLTTKGEKILSTMQAEYGGKPGKEVFYASKNKGTITGVDAVTPSQSTAAGLVPELSTSESPTANMGGEGPDLVGVNDDAAMRDRMFPNKYGAKDVGAESWVGGKKNGYQINAADGYPEHPSFKGDRSLLGNKDATPVYAGLKKG